MKELITAIIASVRGLLTSRSPLHLQIAAHCMGLLVLMLCPAAKAQTPPRQLPADTPLEMRQLIEDLSANETQKRIEAAEELGAMGPRAAPAVPALIANLRHRGLESVRIGNQQVMSFNLSAQAAATALGRIGKVVIPQLRTVLNGPRDEYSDRPLWAARALARMRDPAAMQLLLTVAKQPASVARADIAMALGDSQDPQALEALLVFVKDSDATVRKRAAEGLGEKKDTRALDALLTALRDVDANVRSAAAGGLLRLADPRAYDALVAALKDSHALVRNLSAQALGKIKDARAVEPLINVVTGDADNLVRFQAGNRRERAKFAPHL